MVTFCSTCGGELTAGARFCQGCGAAVGSVCSSCGGDLGPEAAFCPSCGAPRSGPAEGDAQPEELRVVSCLFADLAGFTSHTERSDPEDVRARLAMYHGRVREDVARWDGSVEKLMGDGVFAVFGVPAIHEDDPERAVRTALRIQQSVEELNAAHPELDLSVRIGITTGEAIVQLDSRDTSERIVGDVVNTASRLEGVAPPGAVVIDERTYLAVRHAIRCEPMDRVEVKGKAAPLVVWEAKEARSRYGVAVTDDEQVAMVGRREELSLLVDALDRAIARRAPQLVTISGEPGVGKSRLVRELWSIVDDRADLVVRWRQGRSLPYGEGVTFWALSEIVKAEAGILESEPPEAARGKLRASIDALADGHDDVDTEWLLQRMAPLAGTGSPEGIDRLELFSAWLRYVELLAARHPLVLVIEDLHWADEALAEFLEHILDWAQDAPVLLVCTARPEWFTRRPDWGGGNREAATIGLEPLSAGDTAALVAGLTERAVMAADVQQTLLDRSGGNPLYLIEYVHLAREKGWFERAAQGDELPLPDSVQAIIAARLDLLDADDRTMLQAAAVAGRVFWAGAISFLRDSSEQDARDALVRLVRRGLLRPVRRSSMQGQEEFAFTHVLARDVAYAQLTRGEKARLHREMARWLEAVSGGRAIDVAELLAHHLTTALELEPTSDRETLGRTYRFLMLAVERSRVLDLQAAARFAGQAAEIAPTPTERARALLFHRHVIASREEALAGLTEAVELFEAAGDRLGQMEALGDRAGIHWWSGNRVASDHDGEKAMELATGMPPSPVVGATLAGMAAMRQLAGRESEAIELAERALRVAAETGDLATRSWALRIRGSALLQIGELAGNDDVEEALRIDLDRGDTRQVMSGYNNLATYLGFVGRARDALEAIDEAIAYGTQRGAPAQVEWSWMTKCEAASQLGMVDVVDDLAERIEVADAARGGSQVGLFGAAWRNWVRFVRGDVDEAWRSHEPTLRAARDVLDPQALMPALAWAIQLAWRTGRREELAALADEFLPVARENPGFLATQLPQVVEPLLDLGRIDDVASIAERTLAPADWSRHQVEWALALVDERRDETRAPLDRLMAAIAAGDDLGLTFHTVRLRIDAARIAGAAGEDALATELIDRARADAETMGFRTALDDLADLEGTRAAG